MLTMETFRQELECMRKELAELRKDNSVLSNKLTMETFGQEWECMRNELADLKKDNSALSNKVSTLTKSGKKDREAIREECLGIKTDLSNKIGSLEADLAGTKQSVSTLKTSQEKEFKVIKDGCIEIQSDLLDTICSLEANLAGTKQSASTLKKSHEKDLKVIRERYLEMQTDLSHKICSLEIDFAGTKQSVSTLKMSCENEIKAVNEKCVKVKTDLSVMNDGLVETKQSLKDGMRKVNDFYRVVESLKKVWNRILMSAHQAMPSYQASSQPTPTNTSSGADATSSSLTFTSIPTLVRRLPSVPSANEPSAAMTSPIPSVDQGTAKPLINKERESLKDMSSFHVEMTRCRTIQAGDMIKLDRYEAVDEDSEYIDEGLGVYTTPVIGTYGFVCDKYVKGEGDVAVYLCGGDGRREHMAGPSVEWDCPEGLTVWLEVKGRGGCGDTVFMAGFSGYLILSRLVLI